MTMTLSSSDLELRVLKTVCRNTRHSARLLGMVTPDLLHTAAARNAYHRVLAMMKEGDNPPPWSGLCEDPILSEADRRVLRSFRKPPLKATHLKGSIKTLNKYSRARTMLDMATHVINEFKTSDKLDIDKLTEECSDKLAQARTGRTTMKMYRMGTGSNVSGIIDRVLKSKGKRGIPTGFSTWDKRNGVIPHTACWLMGGPTGGGKSIMGKQIGKNLAEMGFKVKLGSFEMNVDENIGRMLSDVGNVPVHKVMQGEKGLTRRETRQIRERMAEWEAKCAKLGGSLDIPDMDNNPTVTEFLYSMLAYSPDLIIIDYIALLDGMDGDDDWRKLSEGVRQCKRFAKSKKIPVLVLCQLDDTGKLLYSKRMAHDADLAWFWNGGDEVKETGIITIKQPKARNLDPFTFQLKIDWEYMRAHDLEDAGDEDAVSSASKKPRMGKKLELRNIGSEMEDDL